MSASIQVGYEEDEEQEDMRQRPVTDESGDSSKDDGVELSSSHLNPLNPGVTSPLHSSASQRSR
jgi:hypothetical protein